LNINLSTVDVLCFTKHWLIEDEITYHILPNYSLVTQYCRKNKKNWGSDTFEKYNSQTTNQLWASKYWGTFWRQHC